MDKSKIVIIYRQDGTEFAFTTNKDVHESDSNYKLVEIIECEPSQVKIGYYEDDNYETKAYVGMPYYLNIWKKK